MSRAVSSASPSSRRRPAATRMIDDRRSAIVGMSDWATANLRWDLAARAGRWCEGPVTLGVGGALERHLGDAAAVRLQGDVWPAGGFGAASLGARWRWRGRSRPSARVRDGDRGESGCPARVVGRRGYRPRPAPSLARSPVARRGRDHRRRLRPAACARRCGVAPPPLLAGSADTAVGCLWRRGGRIPWTIDPRPGIWMQASACACASPARARCGSTMHAGSTMAGRPCRLGGNCRGRRGRDTTHGCRRRFPLPLLTPDGPGTLAGSRPFSSQRCGSASATTACAPSSSST